MPSKLVKIITAVVAVVILIICIVIVSTIVGTQNGTIGTQNGQNKEPGIQNPLFSALSYHTHAINECSRKVR